MNAETGICLQISDSLYRDRGSTELHGVSGKSYTFAYSDWFGFQVLFCKDAKEHDEAQKDLYGEEFQRDSMYRYGIVTRYLTPEQNAQMAEAEAFRQRKRQAEIDTAVAANEALYPVALKEWEENLAKAKAKMEYAQKRREAGEVQEHDVEGKKALDRHIVTLQEQVDMADGHVKRLQEELEKIAARKKKEKPTVTIPDPKALEKARVEDEKEAAADAKALAKAEAKEAAEENDDDRKSPGGRSRR